VNTDTADQAASDQAGIAAPAHASPGVVGFDTLLAHAGPVVVLTADSTVLRCNDEGERLRRLFSTAGADDLRTMVRDCLKCDAPATHTLQLHDDRVASTLVLTLLPSKDGQHVVVLGRNTSLEVTLRSALADSRARYKDFVELSSDFTWETGGDGRFTFVSPTGVMGHEARTLVGTDPVDLLDPSEVRAGGAIFVTRQRVRDVEIWARHRDGRLVCLLTSAMPVFDAAGTWIGVRGICRDITDQRDRERALNRARNRERVRAHVVRTFRDELNLENMLNVAAEALARGLGATTCHILRRPPLSPEGTHGLVLGGHFGANSEPSRLSGILDTLDVGTPPWDARIGDQSILVAATSHRHMINGAVALWRKMDRGPWSEDDRLLIQDVANQVGIANEQIARHETIIAMSRTDSLTGLLNRRAFFEDIDRRHKRLERSDRKATLLYVDMDNFKLVNDVHGHFRGDEALILLGELLSTHTRPTDLVARLGGDEFALWLEDADEGVATRKAEELLAAGDRLLPYSGDPHCPLTLSIGLAVFDPADPEDLQALTARADAAMYSAKQAGKGRPYLAPPASVAMTEDTPGIRSGSVEVP